MLDDDHDPGSCVHWCSWTQTVASADSNIVTISVISSGSSPVFLVLYLWSTSKGMFVVCMVNTTVCLPHHDIKCAEPW